MCIRVYQHILHHVPPDKFSHCPSKHQTRQAVKDHCLTLTAGFKAAKEGNFHFIDHHDWFKGHRKTGHEDQTQSTVGDALKTHKTCKKMISNSCAKTKTPANFLYTSLHVCGCKLSACLKTINSAADLVETKMEKSYLWLNIKLSWNLYCFVDCFSFCIKKNIYIAFNRQQEAKRFEAEADCFFPLSYFRS